MDVDYVSFKKALTSKYVYMLYYIVYTHLWSEWVFFVDICFAQKMGNKNWKNAFFSKRCKKVLTTGVSHDIIIKLSEEDK